MRRVRLHHYTAATRYREINQDEQCTACHGRHVCSKHTGGSTRSKKPHDVIVNLNKHNQIGKGISKMVKV
jgi:hypothetical protein